MGFAFQTDALPEGARVGLPTHEADAVRNASIGEECAIASDAVVAHSIDLNARLDGQRISRGDSDITHDVVG